MLRIDRVSGWGLLIAVLLFMAQPGWAQDKSVKPGINKSFQNPDVKKYVGRFERDGRDAYDHRDEILKVCDLKPGMVIADIGAGTGLFTRLFAPKVAPDGKVYAVDIAEKFVNHVEKTSREAGFKNVVGVVCSQDSVKLPPNSVDLVYICDVYHHFEYPYKTMRSIHKALRPGGQVVLVDFDRIEGVSSKFVLGHVRAGKEIFTREITESGFRMLEEKRGFLKVSYLVRFEKVDSKK